jgi:hypothetical protein
MRSPLSCAREGRASAQSHAASEEHVDAAPEVAHGAEVVDDRVLHVMRHRARDGIPPRSAPAVRTLVTSAPDVASIVATGAAAPPASATIRAPSGPIKAGAQASDVGR